MPIPSEIKDHPIPYELARDIAVYRGHCWRVVDGDTLYAQCDLGFHRTPDIGIRIEGPKRRRVDAPEIYGVEHESEEYKLGKEAYEWVEARFKQFPMYSGPVGPILHRAEEVGKFGRSIGRVWIPVDQEIVDASTATLPDAPLAGDWLWADLAVLLVQAGHAEWVE